MEKIIKFTIENTTKTREVEETYSELYSHDRNNGLFEFEIANEQLAGKNLIALFKFVKTGSYWKTEAVVEDNKAKIKFDTSLITQNEKVICFIYVNEEIRDADIFRFKFNVRVSEIDKAKQLPLKERFYAHGLIVDRLDVLTKEDFDNAIKEIEKGSKFLTEAQANEKYALKDDIPNISNLATTTELEKRALKTDIPSTETIVNKAVEKVEKKGYLTQHQSLAGYVTESQLEGKNYLTQHQSLNGYVTETQLNEKGYLTKHQDISGLATKKSVEDVEAKVTQLENRPVTSSYDDSEIKREIKELKDRPVTANIDTSNFVTNTQLEDKHYLTEHQDIKGLATKEELKKAFLDEENHEKYAKKTELPQPYNDADIKSRLTVLENKPSGSSSELRGHGFPSNIDVPIGTTYIDEDVTNGALKWIKTKTKWKVIEGDTGWVNVPVKNVQPNTKMELRRVNNLVYVRFFNELAEGLAKFTNLYNADTTTRYLTIFKGLASFGWRPSTTQIQVIFPEINQGGNDYIYNTAQPPQPYLRLKTIGAGLNVDMQLDELVITNNNLGVYINSFSYLTNDDWAPSLNII
jgi:hypothetical protein|nr:MAG TPA: hypothetical protein [Caudoviricetes sp.]